jgi:hypothetical protein
MPQIYEIEQNGEVFTVEANSDEEALALVKAQAQQPASGQKQDFSVGDALVAANQQDMSQFRAAQRAVPEVLKRIIGGVHQGISAVQDAYNARVHGIPYYDPFVDPRTGKRGGYTEASQYRKTTIEEAARQQIAKLEADESGVNPKLFDLAASAGENAALGIASEAGLARGATTLTGNLIRQATAGGAQAAVQFDADGSGWDTILGASGSAATGILTGLGSAVRNMAARGLQKARSARTAQALDSAASVLPNFEQTVTLAQRTGIPEIKTLEQAAYNSTLTKAYADQTDKLIEDVSNVLQQNIAPGQNLDTDFIRARAVADNALKSLRDNTARQWNAGLARVKSLIPTSGPRNVPAQNVVAQFGEERENFENVLKTMSRLKISNRTMNALKGVLDPRTTVPNQHPRVKGLDVDTLADMMQGLTGLQRETTDPVVKGFATRMRVAIDKDIQNLASYNGPALPAVSELLQTRAEYQRGKMLQKLMQDSVTYKLLGVGQKPGAAIPRSDELLANFSSFSPEKQREVRIWAEQHSPDILRTMRQATINDAVQRARTIGPASDSVNDLGQLTDALFDSNRGFDLRTSGLWDKTDQAKFEGIRNALRVVANQRTAGRGAGTPIKSEDIAINLISRSMPFLARQISRVAFGSKAADFFTDPTVYKYLTDIRQLSGPTQLSARMGLMELLQTEYDASPFRDNIDEEVARQRGQ